MLANPPALATRATNPPHKVCGEASANAPRPTSYTECSAPSTAALRAKRLGAEAADALTRGEPAAIAEAVRAHAAAMWRLARGGFRSADSERTTLVLPIEDPDQVERRVIEVLCAA